jgi:hypothetical protein
MKIMAMHMFPSALYARDSQIPQNSSFDARESEYDNYTNIFDSLSNLKLL